MFHIIILAYYMLSVEYPSPKWSRITPLLILLGFDITAPHFILSNNITGPSPWNSKWGILWEPLQSLWALITVMYQKAI